MRKTVLILLMLCGLAATLPAQDIRTLFMEAPDSVLPLLPRNARADCVDFADAKMVYPVSNLLGGKSLLKELDENHLLLQSTASSTVEMKLLPIDDSFVICVVNTVYAEVADSRVAFFDRNWKRIGTEQFFTYPSIKDFFVGTDNRLLDYCDMYLVSLKLNPADDTLVAEYTMPGYMNDNDAQKVLASLRKLVYRWNGVRFVME